MDIHIPIWLLYTFSSLFIIGILALATMKLWFPMKFRNDTIKTLITDLSIFIISPILIVFIAVSFGKFMSWILTKFC